MYNLTCIGMASRVNPYIPKGLSTSMMQQHQYGDGQLEIMEMMKSMFPMKSGGSSDGQDENGNP